MAIRLDRGTIHKTGSGGGFLRARVTIARDGVFPYLMPNGQVRLEAKLPEDIFSDLTIESAKGAPITQLHVPIEEGGLVTSANYQKHIKGALGDSVTVVKGHLSANETVFDQGLIEKIDSGELVEISIGFETEIDPTPGDYQGQRYDARQRNIRINHVAHVPEGRAGETVRVHLDAAIGKSVDVAVMMKDQQKKDSKNTTQRGDQMDENAFVEFFKNLFAFLSGKKKEEGAAGGDTGGEGGSAGNDGGSGEGGDPQNTPPKGDAKDNKLSQEIQKNKALQARVDALEAALKKITGDQKEKDEAKRLDAAVNARISLIETAKAVCKDLKHDGMTNREIKLKVIGATLPFEEGVKTDSLEDVVIDARYDAAMALAREKAAIMDDVPPGSVRIDEKEIAKKRDGRLNMMSQKQ